MTFRAVRSRCMTLASERSVETSAGRERVGEPEGLLVGAAVPLVGVDAVEQDVPDGLAAVDRLERGLELVLRLGALRAEQSAVGDEREVVVAEDDRREAALLVAEGPVERLLLGTARAGVGEPAAQVHLPGDERDQRDGAPADGGLDELGQLLGLAAEELAVLHREREPQHELVEEENARVIAEALGVARDGGQPGVEVDELRLLGVRAEEGLDERGDELLA